MRRVPLTLLILLALSSLALSGGLISDKVAIGRFNRSYNRLSSRVMMRFIEKPTLAALDYAAYHANVMLNQPEPEDFVRPPEPLSLEELSFGGALSPPSLRDRIEQTPLTREEISSPMAWSPMMDYLAEWNYDESLELMMVGAKVSGEKWGNPRLSIPPQSITTAYLHGPKGKEEIWVKVEFKPWVKFLKGVDDEDKDGFPEIYGRIDPRRYSRRLIARLKGHYLSKLLSASEVEDYFHELSSNWYEKYNTDMLDVNLNCPWPNLQTEPEIVKELGGIIVRNPTAIIKGRPFGRPIYNLFVVDPPDENMKANIERWKSELQRWGDGSWERWRGKISGFQKDIRDILSKLPKGAKGIEGRNGFLFFRGSLEYILSGDLRKQRNDPFPAIVDYKNRLGKKGIDMLFVIVPAKPELYPEKLSDHAPDRNGPYVTPYTRKFLLELAEAGVETIDLLPAFMRERDQGDEPIYMKLDTHWSNRAIRIAAHLIAERIKRYPWFKEVCRSPIRYRTREVEVVRLGDIRGMLPEEERIKYPPMRLKAQQVLNPDGSPYRDDKSSPIVILGDSFCGVFHFEDCKHAGISAHIAKEIGMPVDLIMAYGSGPRIRKLFARRGKDAIRSKRLVIWMTAARDLYNYWAPWEIVPVP